MVLTYYAPYKSGLTVYAERQASELAKLGHSVTVLTSQYDKSLLENENLDGVEVIRLPVAFRVSKGVIMPSLPFALWRLLKKADVINLHLPQGEAGLLTAIARLQKKPVVLTYHCDLTMPSGWLNKLAGVVSHLSHLLSARLAQAIVHNTQDFAEHSDFLRRFLDKLTVIQPPIVNPTVSEKGIQTFHDKHVIKPHDRVIGMVARLATEKGVEYLVDAMPAVLNEVPEARVIFVGQYENVIGEDAYREKIMPMIEGLGEKWKFTGTVDTLELIAFYHLCDILVLPSVNSTESFGMVQIEAMSCGTRVVATDLPGVRQPVLSTGLGKIVPIKNSSALAGAMIQLLKEEPKVEPEVVKKIVKHYAPETVAKTYQVLYEQVRGQNGQ